MDYKEKYEQALERARQFSEKPYLEDSAGIVEYIFPELAESEDEKIRKAIIWGMNALKDQKKETFAAISIDDCIAWLEKQAQKPDTNCLLSWSETDEKMLQSLEGIVKDYWAKAEQEKNEIKIREASNVSYFLKTIQKSPLCWIKCSDGLPNRDGIYLVVTDGRHNDVYDMARYDSIEGWHKASEIIYWMPIPQLNNKSIIEQKPTDNIKKSAWSEEDEKILGKCIDAASGYYSPEDKQGIKDWLKSLKERVQPQPKQEWNEEDEKMIDAIYSCVDSHYDGLAKTSLLIWLKSLRPHSQWKPSDEQINALNYVVNLMASSERPTENDLYYNILKSLRQQLKKLKDEK